MLTTKVPRLGPQPCKCLKCRSGRAEGNILSKERGKVKPTVALAGSGQSLVIQQEANPQRSKGLIELLLKVLLSHCSLDRLYHMGRELEHDACKQVPPSQY
jgi:hypothetical protein